MYEDPENIYTWSKKFIGFKNSDQPSEIVRKSWEGLYHRACNGRYGSEESRRYSVILSYDQGDLIGDFEQETDIYDKKAL